MKISIITVSYNSEGTIKDTIESVLSQRYNDIEYIVIDGRSTDKTTEIIKSYGKKIDYFISEPDDGIYDAMNKGIELATGDVVGILNSDDYYSSKEVLQIVASAFKTADVDCVYGNLEYIDKCDTSRVIRYWKSQKYKDGLFQKGWHPAHPTFFVKRICYNEYGKFNLKFSIAADYEIMLRLLLKYNLSSEYINKTLVKMRMGGESNKSILNIIRSNFQCYQAWKVNDLSVSLLVFFLKPLSKILQFGRKNCQVRGN